MNFEIAPKSTETRLKWNDAKLYCFSLNIDGKTGWRLPNREELNEIFQTENDFQKDHYWSCTEDIGDLIWIQSLYNGGQSTFHNDFNGLYTRAIRDLV